MNRSHATSEDAESLIRARGMRVTHPRVAVLSVLLATREALSHHDVEARLAGGPVDRVTVYRVLDWLVDEGLAHRITAPDRVRRFMADRPGHAGHAHFLCSRCGKAICLDHGPAATVGLPRGFRAESVELTVHGRCPSCARDGGNATRLQARNRQS